MENKIIIILLFISQICFSQNKFEKVTYENLLKFKVDENKFEFGWLPTEYKKTPCFRDYRKNKIQMQLKDSKTDSIFYESEETERNAIKIIPSEIFLDKNNKKLKISGKLSGAWESVIPVEFEIYVGQRKDTISEITLSPNLHGEVYYNDKKVTETIVVDRVPAFYLLNFKKFEAFRGEKNQLNSNYKEMLFEIITDFDKKDCLIFALSSRYTEIFEIGKLLDK